jgi:hypothetical protein
MLPAILALLAAWLLLGYLHLSFLWPGKLVIFLAVFAALRSAMRWLFRSGRGGPGGVPRGRRY